MESEEIAAELNKKNIRKSQNQRKLRKNKRDLWGDDIDSKAANTGGNLI